MRLAASARGYTAGFQVEAYVWLLRRAMGHWAEILLSSHSSEIGPVLDTREPAVDKMIVTRGAMGKDQKRIKFLDNRCQ